MEKVTGEQRFNYIVTRLRRHAEDIDMGAEELSAILISAAAQLLGQTEVKLQDAVATFIADYLAAKEKASTPPVLKSISLVREV